MSGDTLSDWLDRIGEKHGFTESATPEEDEMPSGPSIAVRNDLGTSSGKAPVSFPGDDEEQRRIANARGPNQSRQGQPVSAPGDDSPDPEPVPEGDSTVTPAILEVGKKVVEIGVGALFGVPGFIIDMPFGLESDESPAQREARKRQEEKDLKEFEEEKAKEQRELQEANERGRAPVELNPIKVFDAPAVRETGSSVGNAFQSPAPSFSESAGGSGGGGGPAPEQIVGEPGITVSDDD